MEQNEKPFDGCEYLLPPGCKQISQASWVVTIKKIPHDDPRSRRLLRKRGKEKPAVYLSSHLAVKDLATALGAKLADVIKLLKDMEVFTSVNQTIPFYTAARVAKKYGFIAKKKIKAF